MKTFVQKTVFVQRPGIVPGKVDVRKGKTGGFGFVQRGNGFGKGITRTETEGQNSFEVRKGEKNGKFYSCFFGGKFKAIGNAGLYLFDGAVQVRNSQCKRVFENGRGA